MSQMRALEPHGLPILQHPNILMHALFIPETGPAMFPTLAHKLLITPAPGRHEQQFPGHRIVELIFRIGVQLLGPFEFLRVARVLRVVAVEVADAVGCGGVYVETQGGLHGVRGGPVRFWAH